MRFLTALYGIAMLGIGSGFFVMGIRLLWASLSEQFS